MQTHTLQKKILSTLCFPSNVEQQQAVLQMFQAFSNSSHAFLHYILDHRRWRDANLKKDSHGWRLVDGKVLIFKDDQSTFGSESPLKFLYFSAHASFDIHWPSCHMIGSGGSQETLRVARIGYGRNGPAWKSCVGSSCSS